MYVDGIVTQEDVTEGTDANDGVRIEFIATAARNKPV